MTNDEELKYELASQYADNYRTASRDDAYGSFIDGWDAARANPIPVGAIIDVDQDALIAERDQLRAEVEKLRHELYNRIPIRIESPEYNELKAQCEKLADGLCRAIQWVEIEPVNKEGEDWNSLAVARQALAEYRKNEKGE